MVSEIHSIADFQPLLEKYSLFLFDQFGVLHNGTTAYDGMYSQLLNIKDRDKTVGVISNSGKGAEVNAQRLASFGYGSDTIDKVWTSGELAWQTLKTMTLHNRSNDDIRIFYLGNDKDRSALRGLSISEVGKPEDADVILIAGVGEVLEERGNYKELFQQAAENKIPAYCSNPDLMSFFDDGKVAEGPGAIARLYQELGGSCSYFGKPHVEIYQSIFNDTGIPASETLCIGDSLEHDIAGAAVAGCHSVLVSTGIYENLDSVEFAIRLANAAYPPDYIFGDRGIELRNL